MNPLKSSALNSNSHRFPINDLATLNRRRWLQSGGALAGAMLWPELLRAREAKINSPAKQAIIIYLQGGLSHYESFDPKPDAPSAIRGEFGNISTTIPGIHFSEHLPLLAKHMGKFNLIRSTFVDSPSHPVAIHMTLTGADLAGASVETKNRNLTHPSIGSVIARSKGPRVPELPGYVAIPHSGQLGQRVHYATAGSLGNTYNPLHSGMVPDKADGVFAGPEILTLPSEQNNNRLRNRMGLLKALNETGTRKEINSLDTYHRLAYELLKNGVAGSAFDLNRESLKQRERYGNHLWGQQTILARRLAEAGVPVTLVNYTLNQQHGQDWDTHEDNFNLMKSKLLPPMDLAVSTLLDDLDERGLLETTIVAMFGEFGRTPRINANAGRDHWEKVFSVVMAGGGLKSGVVVGSSTRIGDLPQDRPVHFNDVIATIYHQLGISSDSVFLDGTGRPYHILDRGKPIRELL